MHQQFGRLPFAKRNVAIDGRRRSYVADTSDVIRAIRTLLLRRAQFLQEKDLPGNCQLSNAERQDIIRHWKDEFHALPEQMRQQLRDSWNEISGASQSAVGKGEGKGRGPGKGASRSCA